MIHKDCKKRRIYVLHIAFEGCQLSVYFMGIENAINLDADLFVRLMHTSEFF